MVRLIGKWWREITGAVADQAAQAGRKNAIATPAPRFGAVRKRVTAAGPGVWLVLGLWLRLVNILTLA